MSSQIISADVGVNGLTCSQCSRSVYNALDKLDFIEKIEMDLNETIAHIQFKQQAKVDFNALAQAITKAGYSVRDMRFKMDISNKMEIKDNLVCWLQQCISFDKNIDKDLNTISFLLLGNKYNADRQYQKEAQDENSKQFHALILN